MRKFVIVSATLLIIFMSRTVRGSECDSKSYYKPHPTECTLFYQCSPNGTYVLHTCPPNLHFNPILNVCDFPNESGCSNDHTVDPGDGEATVNPGDGESTSDPNPGTNTTVETPEQCDIGEYLPHETECDAFYRCISGSFFMIYCPDGMQFNITSRGCEVQENGCNNGEQSSTTTEISTETSIDPTTYSGPSTNPSTEFTTDASTEATTEAQTTTEQCVNNEYKPDESDCEAFYLCINGRFVKLFCSFDTHFDPNTQQCVNPEVSGCNFDAYQSTNSPGVTTTEISTSSSTEMFTDIQIAIVECYDNEYQPDESDCEAFNICINGRFVKLFCSIGTHFNIITQQCLEPDVAGCVLTVLP